MKTANEINYLQEKHRNKIIDHALRLGKPTSLNEEQRIIAIKILEQGGVKALISWINDLNQNNLTKPPPNRSKDCDPPIFFHTGQNIENCVIDISDVVNYLLAGHNTVSGIQRLVIATLATIPKSSRELNSLISLHSYEKEGVKLLDWSFIDLVVDYLSNPDKKINFNQLVSQIIQESPSFSISSQQTKPQTLLIMGAAWIVPSFPRAHRFIATQHNLQVVSVLYDLIPYTYPDYVTPDATREFYFYIESLLAISDGLISISKYVADDLKNHSTSLGKNIVFFPKNHFADLAREIPFQHTHTPSSEEHRNFIKKAIDFGIEIDNFALNVGSVEIRKNHIGTFVAWRHLLAQLGSRCPQLVVIGRAGWKAEAFFEALKSTNNLDGKLIVLHGIDDSFLAYLYSSCRFTIYPSLEEGWGLPIGESLDAGKLCITSNRASMPEVGGPLCLYVDPTNPLSLANEVEKIISSPEVILRAERSIEAAKPLKSWLQYQNHLADLISKIKNEVTAPINSRAAANHLVKPGQVVSFYWHLGSSMYDLPEALSGKSRSLKGSFPSRLIVDSKHGPFEPDGVWLHENNLSFSFYINSHDFSKEKEFNSISISIHYMMVDSAEPLDQEKINATCNIFKQELNNQQQEQRTGNFAETRAIVHSVASDLVGLVFNFENILTDFKHEISRWNIIPIRIKISLNEPYWNRLLKIDSNHIIKIKEIRIE